MQRHVPLVLFPFPYCRCRSMYHKGKSWCMASCLVARAGLLTPHQICFYCAPQHAAAAERNHYSVLVKGAGSDT